MSSKADEYFTVIIADVDRLMEFHEAEAGVKPGRKWNVEVLNKAGVVLAYAAWEAYVEDACKEAAAVLINHLADSTGLSAHVKAMLAEENAPTKADPVKSWRLADGGWKQAITEYASKRTDGLQQGGLNTARPHQVRELFWDVLGLQDVTASWAWQNKTPPQAVLDLNNAVTLRGAIVHRGEAETSVTKKQCVDFCELAEKLVERTDLALNSHLMAACGHGFQ